MQILILDEADRLLEVGFKEELDMIIRNCPFPRTTMLFSATMTGTFGHCITNLRSSTILGVDGQAV